MRQSRTASSRWIPRVRDLPQAADEATPGVEYVACDVTNDLAVDAAVREVLAKAGRIDLLVNNAGVGLTGAAEESSLEQAKFLFDVNLFGVIRMTKAVLPSMRQRGRDASSTSARCWA